MINPREQVSIMLDSDYGNPGTSMTTGVLLVGHGTRDKNGLDEFWEVVHRIAAMLPGMAVEGAFLEIASPDIAQGIERLMDRRCEHVIVAPLLLFAAGHAKHDIPAAVENSIVLHPGVAFSYSRPLELDPKLVDLSVQRFEESLESRAAAGACRVSRGRISLIVVGRGSRDEDATRFMHDYAGALASRVQVGRYHVGFLAMAEPHVDIAMQEALKSQPAAIVVQPHLLFRGELLGDLKARVQRHARRFPEIDWRVASHLGPSGLVAEALVARLTKISRSTT